MPQISLYIDKDTLLKIEKAAKQEKISLSKWVGKNIKKAIQEDYPPKYFELFGAIVD
ncbi:MAG: toxin-antitoxin system, antitoxin component, partial [Spirochaetia bacterium]|nr:toxin-antitoxin system, antitoxin component [Spirochaetia bacterium]